MEGESKISLMEEYTSDNTYQLNIEETKTLLLKLPFIRRDVMGEKFESVYAA